MPTILSRQCCTWLLVLSIGHVPLPWVHCHAWLDGDQLAEHINAFHAGCLRGDVPESWHVHFCYLGGGTRIRRAGMSTLEKASHPTGLADERLASLEEVNDASPGRERKGPVWAAKCGLFTLKRKLCNASGSSQCFLHTPRLPGTASLFRLHCSLLL